MLFLGFIFDYGDSFPVPPSGFTDEPETEVGSSRVVLLLVSIPCTPLLLGWVASSLLLPAPVGGGSSGGTTPLLILYRQVGQVSCCRGNGVQGKGAEEGSG